MIKQKKIILKLHFNGRKVKIVTFQRYFLITCTCRTKEKNVNYCSYEKKNLVKDFFLDVKWKSSPQFH